MSLTSLPLGLSRLVRSDPTLVPLFSPVAHVALEVQRRKPRQRSFVYARQLDDDLIELLHPLGFDRLKAVAEHRVPGRVEKRLHLRPLGEEGLPHLIAQSG